MPPELERICEKILAVNPMPGIGGSSWLDNVEYFPWMTSKGLNSSLHVPVSPASIRKAGATHVTSSLQNLEEIDWDVRFSIGVYREPSTRQSRRYLFYNQSEELFLVNDTLVPPSTVLAKAFEIEHSIPLEDVYEALERAYDEFLVDEKRCDVLHEIGFSGPVVNEISLLAAVMQYVDDPNIDDDITVDDLYNKGASWFGLIQSKFDLYRIAPTPTR